MLGWMARGSVSRRRCSRGPMLQASYSLFYGVCNPCILYLELYRFCIGCLLLCHSSLFPPFAVDALSTKEV